MKKVIFLMGFWIPFTLSAQSLKLVWETPHVLKTPESVFYNAHTNQIYVSSINGKLTAHDGNGFITLLNTEGKILKLKWVQGLNGPKGMTMKGHYLYVSDINRLAKIDVRTHKIIHFFPAKDAVFLNDVQVGTDGIIYVTDSGRGAIYKLENGKLTLWMIGPLLKGANGLAWENGKLLVGVNGHLLQINTVTKAVRKLAPNQGGIDGLVPLGNNRYLVSNWAGRIQIISPGKEPVVLSNTTAQHINAADLGYIPKHKLVLIPTFYDNRVIAKELINR